MRLGDQLSQGDIYFPDASGKPIVTGGIQGDILYALCQTPSTGLRHPSLEGGAGKRCSECGPMRLGNQSRHWWCTRRYSSHVSQKPIIIDISPKRLAHYSSLQGDAFLTVANCPHRQHALVTTCTNTLWPNAHTTSARCLVYEQALSLYEHAVAKCPHPQRTLFTVRTSPVSVRTRCGPGPHTPACWPPCPTRSTTAASAA